jgi:purine-binding chemotaxis protein CheW
MVGPEVEGRARGEVTATGTVGGGDAGGATWVLSFQLAGQEHAVPVGDVVEVVRMVAVTPLPESVPWVIGVLNYRGRVVPVVDARARLGLPRRTPGPGTHIVVVAAGGRAAGLVVDMALAVRLLPAGTLEPPDHCGAGGAVRAVARQGRRLILLLDTAPLIAGSGDPGRVLPGSVVPVPGGEARAVAG